MIYIVMCENTGDSPYPIIAFRQESSALDYIEGLSNEVVTYSIQEIKIG